MTRSNAHVFVSISPHGLGHAAIATPVLNALRKRAPDVAVTLHSSVPKAWFASRLDGAFQYTGRTRDFGMVMRSPTDIDVEASAARYAQLMADWDDAVQEERALMREAGATLVVSNISFVTLAAARAEGIAALSLCPFDWAEVYSAYCAGRPEAADVLRRMEDAYAGVDVALRPAPAVPSGRAGLHPIGPIASVGRQRSEALRRAIGARDGEHIGLVAFGGIQGGAPHATWPRIENWRWISGQAASAHRPDMIPSNSVGMPFLDILHSVDAVITKPGYSTFAEAACMGIPVLTQERPGWPEWPHMFEWLQNHVPARSVSRDALDQGRFAPELADLLSSPPAAPARPSGVEEAVSVLCRYL